MNRLMRSGAVLSLPLLAGCAAAVVGAILVGAAVGVGTYLYVNNELQRDYEAALEPCHDAATRAVVSLKLAQGGHSVDFQKGSVETAMADGRSVRIVCEKKGEKTTLVSIRVGTFESDANRDAAQRIHEQLYKELTGRSER
jgi:hypothetical protein